MKKTITLIALAISAISANAQDVYNAIADGKLAPEFAAVSGESGGVANNTTDGKSIVVMKAGKATVTGVGGTTPANDPDIGGAAQQITIGAPRYLAKELARLEPPASGVAITRLGKLSDSM